MSWAIECAPQGDGIAVVGNAFEIVDLRSGQRLVQILNPEGQRLVNWPPFVQFTPDGSVAVWGASEKDVYAVDVPRQSLTRLRIPFDDVTSVTLSRDGRTCVTGHVCGVVYVWDLPTLLADTEECVGLDTDPAMWEALACADSIRALCALWRIVDRGKEWIPTIAEYLQTETFAEQDDGELLRGLESESYVARELAMS